MNQIMTIKDIRKVIEGLPDDTPIEANVGGVICPIIDIDDDRTVKGKLLTFYVDE